ncbi:hypothetical protein QQF64_006289 [Cirrhinus molitorella]|uniref:non-specific serine/threonine protein kinase n=1 Tax=Cirrhinus molitorella TaxID=172907 RepID=A0ABR3MF22_9TELE
MGQRVNKVSPMTVGEVSEQHPSTPPTPSTNMEVQHSHLVMRPLLVLEDEEEERKEEKKEGEERKEWRAAKKHPESSSGRGEVEQQDEGEKRKVAGRSSYVPLPKEIALTILANKGGRVPEIIRLLDWAEHPDHFVIVLKCPSPCENLVEFMRPHAGSLDEDTTRQIMWQVVNATHVLPPQSAPP